MAKQRGLDYRDEQDQQKIIRDTRTLGEKIGDFLKKPHLVAVFMLFLIMLVWFVPALSDVILIFSLGVFIFTITRKTSLPFKMPQRSNVNDINDPAPGSNKPRKARGIYHLGNDLKTSEELWFSNDDMRTHALIFGSTGSGKTEALVSIAYNALVQASGFIYVDGKGDNSLYAKIFSMARSMGRGDDILLINFMTGARDIIGPQKTRLSNTMNPFSSGSSSMVSQLIVSLMDSSGDSSDGDMWKGRAIGFVEALMRFLVAMRDAGYILLDANSIRNYFHLDKLETIVVDRIFPRDGMESVKLDFLPPSILEPLSNYLLTLPGYNKDKKGKQVSQVLEQHGFVIMQLTRVFTSLADTYGHIMRTNLAEVDLKDVVLNRRILVVLLPALEKAPDELSNLGKIVIASLKAMMAYGLGDAVEGSYSDVVQRKPTNASTPYLCILDEYGYYAVEGFAVVPAQARSLGFSVIFAGQDLPAFQKASKEEAASIGANTNIKVCMKLEDPVETWDFFSKTAGEAYVSHVESFSMKPENTLNNYRDTSSAKLEKRSRVDLLDLKEQREGEGHMFFKSKLVRMKFFFANPKPAKYIRLNHFLKVEPPIDYEVAQLKESFTKFDSLLNEGFDNVEIPVDEEFDEFIANLNKYPRMNNSMDTLANVFNKVANSSSLVMVDRTLPAMTIAEGNVNIYSPLVPNDIMLSDVTMTASDRKAYLEPLLDRQGMCNSIEYINRILGFEPQVAMDKAIEVLVDFQRSTTYPPKLQALPEASKVAADIERLIEAIVENRNKVEEDEI
jgi:intracellular multiplication protein IcmO